METHTALAKVEGDKATVLDFDPEPVWSAKRDLPRPLDCRAQKVRVITPFVGGGFFGGKTRNTQAVEAARLSKAAGKPVQVAWSRAEEFFYDTFRPAAIVKISSGIDGSGKMAFLGLRCSLCGERGAKAVLFGRLTTALPPGLPGGRGRRGPILLHRRLARAQQQHQHLCPGITD